MSRVFLSHSSKDLREAVALKEWLTQQDPPLANEIFLDADPTGGIQAGERWKEALRRASTRCEAVICLLSKNWESSSECFVEYRVAETLNKQILCARLEPSTGDQLTAEWQRCDLFGGGHTTLIDVGKGPPVKFATDGLYRLRDAIRGAGIEAESFVWPPPSQPGRAPYRGWEPFEEVDAGVFFGRDGELVQALDQLRGMRNAGRKSFFVVLGPSGTGKSSFLRAGLLPRLRREDRRFAPLNIVRPEQDPLTGDQGLSASISAARQRYGLVDPPLGDIKQACAEGNSALVATLLNEIRDAVAGRFFYSADDQVTPKPPTLILPLDQAEELFSAESVCAAREFLTFLREVTEVLNDAELGLIIAATIRTDRYTAMQIDPAVSAMGSLLFDELKPMPVHQFKEVITGPALRATQAGHPLELSPQLVDRLVADAKGGDALPLLSLTLSRLFRDYASTGRLTVEQYEKIGGVDRAVQIQIDDIFSSDPAERESQLNVVRAAFIPFLATFGADSSEPLRRTANYADLPEASRPYIDAFVNKRLIVKDKRGDNVVVEVALESLLRQWDELASWLRERRADLLAADDLERAADAWQAHGRDNAWLLTGLRLSGAEKLLTLPGFGRRLSTAQGFLAASREAENKRRQAEDERRDADLHNAQERQALAEQHAGALRRRSRILWAALASTVAVALAATVFFIQARSYAKDAEARLQEATTMRLLSEVDAILAGTAVGGTTEAYYRQLAAYSLSPEKSQNALYNTIIQNADTKKVISLADPLSPLTLSALQLSPDAAKVAAAQQLPGGDWSVRLWDTTSGQPWGQLHSGLKGVNHIEFSPDGKAIAVSGASQIQVWEADSGQRRAPPIGANATATAFSRDGDRLVVGDGNGNVQLWNLSDGQPVGPPAKAHPDRRSDQYDAIRRLVVTDAQIVSASADGSVRLWDSGNGSLIRESVPGKSHDSYMNLEVGLSANGLMAAVAQADGVIEFKNAQTGQVVGDPRRLIRQPRSIAISPDGLRVFAAFENDVGILHISQNSDEARLAGHLGTVEGVAVSGDGRTAASLSRDNTIRLWNSDFPLYEDRAFGMAFTADGNRLTAISHRGIRVWDVETDSVISGPDHLVNAGSTSLPFSRDGRLVAVGSGHGKTEIWNVESRERVAGPFAVANDGYVTRLALTEDGKRLAIGSGHGFQIWDVDGNQAITPVIDVDESIDALAFSPDGRSIVSDRAGGALQVWDVSTGRPSGPKLKDKQRQINSLKFSPDGRFVAAGDYSGTLQIWDVSSAKPVSDPVKYWVDAQNSDAIGDIAFTPDGRRIATAGRAGVRLWDAQTGYPIGPIISPSLTVHTVVFSRDERLVATGASDGSVRFWPSPSSADPATLCAKLVTNMTRTQWQKWVGEGFAYRKTCKNLPDPAD